jgi:hypothetical protein
MARFLIHVSSMALVCVACGHAAEGPHDGHSVILGSERGVTAKDGSYDGYRVSRRCRLRGCIGVTGTGAHWASGMERDRMDDDVRFRAGFESFRARVTDALRGLGSFHQSSLGGGCTGFGLVLGLNDWRELDPAIARIGRLLRDDDLREEITLCVTTAPQLDVSTTGQQGCLGTSKGEDERWRH